MAGCAASGLVYLAGQLVSEREVLGPDASPRGSRRPLEEALTALRKGALLLKHGRHGKPKVHYFRVTACDTLLRWRSASGSLKQVKLRSVSEVAAGQATDVFRRHPLREPARSFSLLYTDEDGSSRTLDLTCADEQQFELWYGGLAALVRYLRSLGAPVAGAAAAAGGTPAAPASAGGSKASTLPSEVARWLQRQPSTAGGAGGDRIPCDLLAWGAAQRAPVTASVRSSTGAQEDCWQHRSAPGLAPGGAFLDASVAAVGRKHAAVVTATGAVYTWGEGRAGKLGLGHDQDQPQPQRIRHGLDGQCVVAVACGDDCTAAVTDTGSLYMWGRLHMDSRPQLVPLHVRGDLTGQRVVQVSCGPFHCAAVSADGRLFTWGEGFGGKLGHGDQGSRSHPALVQALAGRQVLEVACGVWHTAAIVVEPEGSPLPPQLQQSPLKAESAATFALPPSGSSDVVGALPGLPPASPAHRGAAHTRNNSTSSALSEASLVHEGQGGTLYTWGGVNESVAFGSSEKHDSNKGCLGHGDLDLYRGQLLPMRVGGALEHRQVRHVAAGSHLTVAVTTGGRVFQMGATGASGPLKHCPWEGATLPELVRGQLQGHFIDEVSCGMHHVVAVGRPLDKRLARPAEHAPRVAFAWGRGSEGQLGVRGFEDSVAPLLVDSLKGRPVLQVTCGGSNTMAVCEHNVQRWEPDSREEGEAASRMLYALTSEPKQLRFQAPGAPSSSAASSRRESERGGGGMAMVRRSFSLMTRSSIKEAHEGSVAGSSAAAAGPPDLARASSGSVRSVGAASAAGSGRGLAQSFSHFYSTLHVTAGQQRAQQMELAPGRLQRMRSDRTTSTVLSSEGGGRHRLVSVGSPVKVASGLGPGGYSHSASGAQAFSRRSTYAGAGAHPHLPGMTSARSFTLSGGGGGRSDISSLSSWRHRPHSDDDNAAGHEGDSGGGALAPGDVHRALSSSADLAAALDDMRSGSSVAALQDELAEKNRIIEQLQRRLEKAQRVQQPAPRSDSGRSVEQRLRDSVALSAGMFREMQQAASPPEARPPAGQRPRPQTSPAACSSGPEEEQALRALERMLQQKERHLEGQQAKLAAWAAELQRREAALAWQQAQMLGRGSEAPGAAAPAAAAAAAAAAVPAASPGSSLGPPLEPIPSTSPVLPAGHAGTPPSARPATPSSVSPLYAARAGLGAQQTEQQQTASPAAAYGGGSGSPGALPDSPAVPGEWTEEFEPGVLLSFAAEGGTKKLRRIRFSRSLFSADSAKQWYEANKHRLAQATGTPHAGTAPSLGPATDVSSSLAGSQPSTPLAAAADEQGPLQQRAGEQQQAASEQQQESGSSGQPASKTSGGRPGTANPAAAGLLHYRQSSRNLSFDARELAAFHERLAAQAASEAGQPPAGQHARPSRLSAVGKPAAAAPACVVASSAAGSNVPGRPAV